MFYDVKCKGVIEKMNHFLQIPLELGFYTGFTCRVGPKTLDCIKSVQPQRESFHKYEESGGLSELNCLLLALIVVWERLIFEVFKNVPHA